MKMKTIKIYNENNVNVNFQFDKLEEISYYGTDASFNVTVTDKETGVVLEKENLRINNIFQGIDCSEDIEIFFENKEIDGDEYDWEIPEEMKEEFNEWLLDMYSEMYVDYEDEEINEIVHNSPQIKAVYNALEFNHHLYYTNNEKVEFLPISVSDCRKYYIDGVEKVYDMNTESLIYKYKGVYFNFYGDVNWNYSKSMVLEILKKTNTKKKVTTEMVENYGIPALSYNLVGKYVYVYDIENLEQV